MVSWTVNIPSLIIYNIILWYKFIGDKKASSYIKALVKGKNLKESDRVSAAMKKNVSTVCDKLCLEMYITGTIAGTNSRFTPGVGPLL